MKLLLVEDNYLLAASVRNSLDATFSVDVAHTGGSGMELATTASYGIIVLDLGLPDMDGQQVCQALRSKGVSTPILVATGVKDPTKCIKLLDCGADDYITKPYNIDVLQARVRALLRRNVQHTKGSKIQHADLEVNTKARTVTRNGITIALRKKEFDILVYLLQNKGQAVTRSMIRSHVWDDPERAWNNTVDVHIKHLRDKIDKPFATPIIKTAFGTGYMVDNTG